ncbi:MAG: histidine phosphatase family protein, partial [Solobacterium sp.]|nr:histidine phosphatase family protein [Solobacterium sp.]
MAVTFYYVRHGQTMFNLRRRLQGTCDSPLTEKGISDARRAELALRKIPFDRAYCSSSERCI